MGANGVSITDPNFHTYDVQFDTNLIGANGLSKVGKGIANSPTPNPNDAPASLTGTSNNVGPIPTTDGINMVRSYLIPSPDPTKYSDITINYTVSGEHSLTEGFVIGYGQISADYTITIRSYRGKEMHCSKI